MKKILFLLAFVATISSAQVPGISAKSYIVTDIEGNVLLEHDSKTVRPIASITKLLVAEQIAPGLLPADSITIQAGDLASRFSRLKINTTLTQDELLHLALISSNNQAIYALARAHDSSKIIAAVNETAQTRGLTSISIEEPSGLSQNNHASAEDLAKFVLIIKDEDIAKISTQDKVAFGGFRSTNPLIGKPGWNFSVSKTGFTNPAGGCIVTMVEIGGQPRVVVILGSRNTFTRWLDLIKIRSYLASDDSFWKSNVTPKQISHKRKRA